MQEIKFSQTFQQMINLIETRLTNANNLVKISNFTANYFFFHLEIDTKQTAFHIL